MHSSDNVLRTTIAPFLSVRNGIKAVEFYKTAFGATEQFRHDDGVGSIVARLSVDGAEFWLADESPEHQNYSPKSLNGSSTRMILTVEDPDAVFNQAVAAGAAVVWEMTNDYGWRIGRIVDSFGHHWEIGRPMPQAS